MEAVSTNKTERKNVYDILKALGIISIVIGHCHRSQQAVDFVYSYHLALFLFVAGIQYNIRKYSTNPFLFLQSRFKSMWPAFFGYLTFFTLTHDLATQLHLVNDGSLYGKLNVAFRVLNNFIVLGGEILGGALWFIPVMLITMMLFAAIVYFSYTYFYRIRLIPIIAFSCLIGALGVYCNLNVIHLNLHVHTGLLLLPAMTAGYIFVHFQVDFKKFFRWYIALPCLLFIYWTVIKNGHRVELSQELIGGSSCYFYIITFCSLYFICYLAKAIDCFSFLSRSFAFLGRYTFDIMSLHFLIFKIIDVCYGRWIGDGPEIYSAFPCAYRTLWPVYVIASIVISPWIRIGLNKFFSIIKNCAQHIFSAPPLFP